MVPRDHVPAAVTELTGSTTDAAKEPLWPDLQGALMTRFEPEVRDLIELVPDRRVVFSYGYDDPAVLEVYQVFTDFVKKLEKAVGFGLELRDDPLLRPDEFKLVVKAAGRDVTSKYAVA